MTIKKLQKGFTIIELLVVIAIIAVLAAIVFANVTQYITKSKDAAIKGNLATALTDAAIFYDGSGCQATGTGDYTGFNASTCWTNISSAITNAGGKNITEQENNSQWCACSQETATSTTSYCVDSTGNKKETPNSTCGTDTCTTTALSCQ